MAKPADDNPNGRRVISSAKLKKLLAADRSARHDVDSIVATIRERIAQAVEKDNLNKGVYGIIKRLDRLPPETLNIWLEDLDHMLDASGLRERAASAPQLSMAGEDPNETEADEEEQEKASKRKGSVTKFPQPRGEAAE